MERFLFWMYYDGMRALADRLDDHWAQVGHRRTTCVECDAVASLHTAATDWLKTNEASQATAQ